MRCYLAKCNLHIVDFVHLQLVTGCGGEALYQTPSTSSQVEQEKLPWLQTRPDQTKKKDEEKNQTKKIEGKTKPKKEGENQTKKG